MTDYMDYLWGEYVMVVAPTLAQKWVHDTITGVSAGVVAVTSGSTVANTTID